MWVLNMLWGSLFMWYLLVIFNLRVCGSSMRNGVVCFVVFTGHNFKESVGPQGAMGLSVIMVFAVHVFLKEYEAPQGAMGLSVIVVIAGYRF